MFGRVGFFFCSPPTKGKDPQADGSIADRQPSSTRRQTISDCDRAARR